MNTVRSIMDMIEKTIILNEHDISYPIDIQNIIDNSDIVFHNLTKSELICMLSALYVGLSGVQHIPIEKISLDFFNGYISALIALRSHMCDIEFDDCHFKIFKKALVDSKTIIATVEEIKEYEFETYDSIRVRYNYNVPSQYEILQSNIK